MRWSSPCFPSPERATTITPKTPRFGAFQNHRPTPVLRQGVTPPIYGEAAAQPPEGLRPDRRCLRGDFSDLYPPPFGRRTLDRLAHRLHGGSRRKAGIPRPFRPSLEQVAEMVHEARPVPDALADRPPVLGVGVARMFGSDAPHAIEVGTVLSISVEELIQPGVFENQRAPVAVDLERQIARPPHGCARHLEHAASPRRETDQCR